MIYAFRVFVITSMIFIGACTTQKMAPPLPIRYKIALVLGGGAAKGFAHVGVIKMLESQGIIPDMIVGTSVGSVVGSLYAAGYSGFELQELAFALDENKVRDISWSTSGLIKGEKLQNYINQLVKNRPIEKLNKTFGAVATDLATGRAVLFQRGNTGQAVRASSSIPGIFQPTLIAGHRYVDGGVVSPIPVNFAKHMGADFIIAVDISAKAIEQQAQGALSIMHQSATIMGQQISAAELGSADIVLRPRVGKIGVANFEHRHIAILEGEKVTLHAIPEIKRKLNEKMIQLKSAKVKSHKIHWQLW